MLPWILWYDDAKGNGFRDVSDKPRAVEALRNARYRLTNLRGDQISSRICIVVGGSSVSELRSGHRHSRAVACNFGVTWKQCEVDFVNDRWVSHVDMSWERRLFTCPRVCRCQG